MLLPALEVRSDCEQSTENGQLTIIAAAVCDPECTSYSAVLKQLCWWHFSFIGIFLLLAFFCTKISVMRRSKCWWYIQNEESNL